MKEILERVQKAIAEHADSICDDVKENGGFSCHGQVDDLKDCMAILRDIHDMLPSSMLK